MSLIGLSSNAAHSLKITHLPERYRLDHACAFAVHNVCP